MVTIELTGGIGNQMFQYALAIKMKHLEKEVCIKPTFGNISLRKYELNCFRGVNNAYIPIVESVFNKPEKRCFFWNKYKKRVPTYKDRIIVYQPEVFEFNNVNLVGYWQNERYFADIKEVVNDVYSFDEGLVSVWNNKLKAQHRDRICPEKENSVSVHVRRTDYYSAQNVKLYGNICTPEYYQHAISYCESVIGDAVYYFFSDDKKWVESELFPFLNPNGRHMIKMIDFDVEDPSFDLWLMTRCKHHIIANSTYSWWGAWLGHDEDKIVISPSVWMNGYDTDIICNDWIRM